MEKSTVNFLHYLASLAGVVLSSCGLISLLVFSFLAPRVVATLNEMGMGLPGLSVVMFSKIPSGLAIVAGLALAAVCFARRTRLTLAAATLSLLLSGLLMLLTGLSIVLPMMTAQETMR